MPKTQELCHALAAHGPEPWRVWKRGDTLTVRWWYDGKGWSSLAQPLPLEPLRALADVLPDAEWLDIEWRVVSPSKTPNGKVLYGFAHLDVRLRVSELPEQEGKDA